MLQAANEYLHRIGLSIHHGQPLNIHERELRRAAITGGTAEVAACAHRGALEGRREPPGGRLPGAQMPGHGAGPERRSMPGAGDFFGGAGSTRHEADRRPPLDHGGPPPGRGAWPGAGRGYDPGGHEPPARAAARDAGGRYQRDGRDGGGGGWGGDARERLDGPPPGASTMPPARHDGRGVPQSDSFDEPWNRDRRRRKRVQSGSSSSSGDERPPPNSRPRCEAP